MEKQKYRSCVGGILLLAAGVLGILSQVFTFVTSALSFGGSVPPELISAYTTTLITTVINSLPVILLGVMLMIKKRGIIITILSGIMLVLNLISLVSIIITITQLDAATAANINWLNRVFSALTYAALLVLSIGAMNPKPNALNKLWFLPGVCYGLCAITSIIFTINNTLSISGEYMEPGFKVGFIIGTILGSLPLNGLYTAGYFLTGHWLANPYKKGYQPQYQQYQYQQPQYQQAQYQQAQYQQYQPQNTQYQQYQQPQYDEQTMQALNYYKWQYESGAITWEQYNASVQQYLNR